MEMIWERIKIWKFDILVGLLYLITISFMVKNIQYLVDIKIHNLILVDYLEAGYFPIPPGYYGLVYLLDLIFRFRYPFVLSSIFVLTFFFWWKYKLVFSWFKTQVNLSNRILFLLSSSLLFLGPIYLAGIDQGLWYLGKFTPTIWHNSTTIAAFPFSILLCFETLKWIKDQKTNRIYRILGLGLILLLIKPSFLFCYVPALPIYILLKDRGFSKTLSQSMIIVLLFFILILLEKQLIFTWDPVREQLYEAQDISKVTISPFKIWLHYSHQPILDLLSSIPFLIFFLVLWGKKAFKNPMFSFTFILLLFAFGIYLIFAETGFRQYHANFYWQIPIALFLNYMSIVLLLVKDYLSNGRKFRIETKILLAVYLIQVAFGMAYWVRIFALETLI